MRALVVAGPRSARIDEVPTPTPGPGQVLLRMQGCGICGSNGPSWEGRPWFRYPLPPGAPGHEGWGVVEAVGEGVRALRLGDRVAALSDHALAEYDVVDERKTVRLPPSLNDQPFPGEALGCAMNIARRSDLRAGQTVAVVGIGFLGALLCRMASRAGARVIAISRRTYSLEIARRYGASEVLPLRDKGEVTEQLKALNGGRLCERVIEAVGNQEALDVAAELCTEGARLIIAGYHQDGPRLVNLWLWNWRGLDVINAHERDPEVYLEGIRMAADAVVSGAIDPAPLYTCFPLERAADAFQALVDRPHGFVKALVTT
ncbi:MAG: zinc-binding dehydrogenase [Myxococcaceae bacterium]|nr:zinc-binding dehydrogenase [Myxococcaceae bacterium]